MPTGRSLACVQMIALDTTVDFLRETVARRARPRRRARLPELGRTDGAAAAPRASAPPRRGVCWPCSGDSAATWFPIPTLAGEQFWYTLPRDAVACLQDDRAALPLGLAAAQDGAGPRGAPLPGPVAHPGGDRDLRARRRAPRLRAARAGCCRRDGHLPDARGTARAQLLRAAHRARAGRRHEPLSPELARELYDRRHGRRRPLRAASRRRRRRTSPRRATRTDC